MRTLMPGKMPSFLLLCWLWTLGVEAGLMWFTCPLPSFTLFQLPTWLGILQTTITLLMA